MSHRGFWVTSVDIAQGDVWSEGIASGLPVDIPHIEIYMCH